MRICNQNKDQRELWSQLTNLHPNLNCIVYDKSVDEMIKLLEKMEAVGLLMKFDSSLPLVLMIVGLVVYIVI